jgi:hypothetical protein
MVRDQDRAVVVGAQVRALNVAGGRIVWCNKLPSLMLFREELYCLFNSLPQRQIRVLISRARVKKNSSESKLYLIHC